MANGVYPYSVDRRAGVPTKYTEVGESKQDKERLYVPPSVEVRRVASL